jgi:hypothetical protein
MATLSGESRGAASWQKAAEKLKKHTKTVNFRMANSNPKENSVQMIPENRWSGAIGGSGLSFFNRNRHH